MRRYPATAPRQLHKCLTTTQNLTPNSKQKYAWNPLIYQMKSKTIKHVSTFLNINASILWYNSFVTRSGWFSSSCMKCQSTNWEFPSSLLNLATLQYTFDKMNGVDKIIIYSGFTSSWRFTCTNVNITYNNPIKPDVLILLDKQS